MARHGNVHLFQKGNLVLQCVLLQWLQDPLEVINIDHKQLSSLCTAARSSTLTVSLQSSRNQLSTLASDWLNTWHLDSTAPRKCTWYAELLHDTSKLATTTRHFVGSLDQPQLSP